MKRVCRSCGDQFILTEEEVFNLQNGFTTEPPDLCDECFDMQEHPEPEHEQFSDADPGL